MTTISAEISPFTRFIENPIFEPKVLSIIHYFNPDGSALILGMPLVLQSRTFVDQIEKNAIKQRDAVKYAMSGARFFTLIIAEKSPKKLSKYLNHFFSKFSPVDSTTENPLFQNNAEIAHFLSCIFERTIYPECLRKKTRDRTVQFCLQRNIPGPIKTMLANPKIKEMGLGKWDSFTAAKNALKYCPSMLSDILDHPNVSQLSPQSLEDLAELTINTNNSSALKKISELPNAEQVYVLCLAMESVRNNPGFFANILDHSYANCLTPSSLTMIAQALIKAHQVQYLSKIFLHQNSDQLTTDELVTIAYTALNHTEFLVFDWIFEQLCIPDSCFGPQERVLTTNHLKILAIAAAQSLHVEALTKILDLYPNQENSKQQEDFFVELAQTIRAHGSLELFLTVWNRANPTQKNQIWFEIFKSTYRHAAFLPSCLPHCNQMTIGILENIKLDNDKLIDLLKLSLPTTNQEILDHIKPGSIQLIEPLHFTQLTFGEVQLFYTVLCHCLKTLNWDLFDKVLDKIEPSGITSWTFLESLKYLLDEQPSQQAALYIDLMFQKMESFGKQPTNYQLLSLLEKYGSISPDIYLKVLQKIGANPKLFQEIMLKFFQKQIPIHVDIYVHILRNIDLSNPNIQNQITDWLLSFPNPVDREPWIKYLDSVNEAAATAIEANLQPKRFFSIQTAVLLLTAGIGVLALFWGKIKEYFKR